ncbi:biliverdin-producing heme oxygenase [Chitinophaga silvisoli]|uniref:Biliverdin-producing heme oxygenase n=1 Tax=Chitinophaga silvisoli TaxID=2291814 RepID=A0A3E1P2V5_9BACT|nr:biliverdin-producing heme oxygenase [Chitinophaga silvisoli]RFM34543.1 biliverdin-producing heme oxygenase [Chitinophaga silvisoli]
MIEQLRESTAELHQDLERTLIPVIKQANSPEAYIRLLQLFYGYYYPLEQYIAAHIDTSFPGGFEGRRKATQLLQDINVINGSPLDPPVTCTNIPEINDNAQALGAMYVLEGSTLGGQVICQIIQRNLPVPEISQALSFFNGYGEETRAKWDSFVHYLEGFHGTEEQKKRLVEAAADTFRQFKVWAQANA